MVNSLNVKLRQLIYLILLWKIILAIYINNKLMITRIKRRIKGCRRKVIIDLNQCCTFNSTIDDYRVMYIMSNLRVRWDACHGNAPLGIGGSAEHL